MASALLCWSSSSLTCLQSICRSLSNPRSPFYNRLGAALGPKGGGRISLHRGTAGGGERGGGVRGGGGGLLGWRPGLRPREHSVRLWDEMTRMMLLQESGLALRLLDKRDA